MSLPLNISSLPSHAVDLIRVTDEAGGAVLVFDPDDRIAWANAGQRALMPCCEYNSTETYESFFWNVFNAGLDGNKQAADDPKQWLAAAVAARRTSPNLDFVNVYPWGRMLVSHLRLDDGTSIQARFDLATSEVGRFFGEQTGGMGVMWALQVQRELRGLKAALDGLSIAIALVNSYGQIIHKNASFGDLLASYDGLMLNEHSAIVATDICDDIVLGQAIDSVTKGILPSAFVPLRRTNAPPLIMAVSEGEAPGTAVAVVSRFGEDHTSLATSIREALGITPAEAEVVAGIGTGKTVSEIAALRNVSEGSTYNQIKSVRATMRRSQFAAADLAGIASLVTKIAAISRTPQGHKH